MGNMEKHPAVRTVFAPYDSGHSGLRMGAGPGHLWDNGLPRMLRSENRPSLTFVDVVPEADPPAEVQVAFELDRLVSEQVREAVAEGEFPLVLSGNCNTSVGTLAGAGPEDLGIVWFDAHADLGGSHEMGNIVRLGPIFGLNKRFLCLPKRRWAGEIHDRWSRPSNS